MTTAYNHRIELTPPTLHHRRVALIKRPPLVRSSSPDLSQPRIKSHKTKKSVRFCDNASLENVRLFLKTEMPKACQSDPICPKHYTYQLRRTNWPVNQHHVSRQGHAIRVEDIQLEMNKEPQQDELVLIGTCQVANLAFEKHITIRYSLDEWTTRHEVQASYQEPIASSANTWDRFRFRIVLKNAMQYHHETLYLAAKYTVAGREFWDNNDNKDFQIDIIPNVQLEDSSSSSSDDEEDDHTFDVDEEDQENHDLIERLKPLSFSDKTSFGTRYDFEQAPLSPTTPIDSSPLWVTKENNPFFTPLHYNHNHHSHSISYPSSMHSS